MIQKKSIKEFGTVKTIKLSLTKPITASYEIEMGKIALFVGTNGVGKSLMLKLVWLLSSYATLKVMSYSNKNIDMDLVMQEFIDKTFDNNDFTGEIEISAPGGNVKIELDNGKVIYSLFDIAPSIKEIPFPIYMSTLTRTYEQIEKFSKLEKDLGQIKVFEYYKMYDVIFCQMIKQKYSNSILVDNELKDSFKNFNLDKHDMKSFIFKNEKFIFIDSKGNEKYMTSLSSGEQSLLNMILANK